MLEGYVDLLYRDDDGLVVVDYKTDAWRTEADLDAKVERYRSSSSAYASALRAVLHEELEARLLFVGPTRAIEHVVDVGVAAA